MNIKQYQACLTRKGYTISKDGNFAIMDGRKYRILAGKIKIRGIERNRFSLILVSD